MPERKALLLPSRPTRKSYASRIIQTALALVTRPQELQSLVYRSLQNRRNRAVGYSYRFTRKGQHKFGRFSYRQRVSRTRLYTRAKYLWYLRTRRQPLKRRQLPSVIHVIPTYNRYVLPAPALTGLRLASHHVPLRNYRPRMLSIVKQRRRLAWRFARTAQEQRLATAAKFAVRSSLRHACHRRYVDNKPLAVYPAVLEVISTLISSGVKEAREARDLRHQKLV